MEYVDRGVEEEKEEEQLIERHAVEVFECRVPLHRESVQGTMVEELATASATVFGLALRSEHWPEVSDDSINELQRQQEQLARLRQLLEYECDRRGKLTVEDNSDCDQVEKAQPEDIHVCYSWNAGIGGPWG